MPSVANTSFFHEGGSHATGARCYSHRRPDGCGINFTTPSVPQQNPATGTIYFWSACDPLGLNPNGSQLFAIQPDGTGLQQLTNAHGFVKAADGTAEIGAVDYLWEYRP